MSDQDPGNRFVVPTAHFHPGAEAEGGRSRHDHRIECLIRRLPGGWRGRINWLRDPGARWARIPAGVLLILGGCLFILPILGIWMIPLGLILLAEDVPVLRRLRDRVLERVERRWPHWFAEDHRQIGDKEETT